MPKFKKITGNYKEVIGKLNLPNHFLDIQTKEAYLLQINKDLHRTAYLCLNKDVDVAKMKERLVDLSHLDTANLSFTQGDFDGGSLTDTRLKMIPLYEKTMVLSKTAEGVFDSLRIAFTDENGTNCALAITYLRSTPTEKSGAIVPVEQQKRPFIVAFIKNANSSLTQREVTIISAPAFMKRIDEEGVERDIEASEIETQEIPTEINKLINSKGFSTLLSGIFREDSISLAPFNELQARLKQNQNLDNRDNKKMFLNELSSLAQQMLPDDAELQQYVNEINQRALDEIDFFKRGTFEKILEAFFEKVNTHLNQLPDSKREQCILNNKLTYFAIRLDLSSFEVTGERSGIILKEELVSQAEKLRSLRDNHSIEAANFRSMTFLHLDSQIESNVSKKVALNDLIVSAKERLHQNNEAITFLEELRTNTLQNPLFLKEVDFKMTLASAIEQINVYIARKEKEDVEKLNLKLADLIKNMKNAIDRLSENAHPIFRQGLIDKVSSLEKLTPNEKNIYNNITFKSLLADTIADIHIADIKRKAEDQKNAIPIPLHISLIHNQSFYQRNRAAILTAIFSTLGVISLILILTGVFAPIGLALGAGTAAVAAANMGVLVGGAVSVGAVMKIGFDEAEYADTQVNVTKTRAEVIARTQEAQKAYDAEIKKIKSQSIKDEKEFRRVFYADSSKYIKEMKLFKIDLTPEFTVPPVIANSNSGGLTIAVEAEHLLIKANQELSLGEKELNIAIAIKIPLPIVAQGKKPDESGPKPEVEAHTTNKM